MSTYEVMLVVASMGSAAGAIAAAVITFFSARSSVQQVRLQSEQYRASMQPYVWADIRPRDEDGQLLELVVGNSGPGPCPLIVDTVSVRLCRFREGS